MSSLFFIISLFARIACSADVPPASDGISMEESLTLRDPFRRPSKYSDPNSDLTTPELERFSIDQIKIVGIITGPKKAKVLLTTPLNKMYIAQLNDKVGNRSGTIRAIRSRSIVVREKIVNVVGQEESADVELKYNISKEDMSESQRGSHEQK